MVFQRFLAIFCLFVCISDSVAASGRALKRDSGGIKIYQNPTPTGYALTRGELTIPASLTSIITVMEDRTTCQRWLYACKQGHLVKQDSRTQRLDYTVIASPLWFADRDMYIYSQTSFDQSKKLLTIRLTGKEDYDQGQPGRIRIRALHGLWQLKEESPTTTQVTYQIHGNPQLPASGFLDAYMVESVFQTLNKLRALAVTVPPQKQKHFSTPLSGNN